MGHTEYIREWRAKNPEAAAYNRAATNARSRALVVLAKNHPAEMKRLLNIERERAGLPPLGAKGHPQYASKRRSPSVCANCTHPEHIDGHE